MGDVVGGGRDRAASCHRRSLHSSGDRRTHDGAGADHATGDEPSRDRATGDERSRHRAADATRDDQADYDHEPRDRRRRLLSVASRRARRSCVLTAE